jgi:hypothetical protein
MYVDLQQLSFYENLPKAGRAELRLRELRILLIQHKLAGLEFLNNPSASSTLFFWSWWA